MSFTIVNITRLSQSGGIGSGGCNYVEQWHVFFTGNFSVPALNYATATFSGLTLPKRLATHPDDAAAYADEIKIQLAGDADPIGTTAVPGIAEYTVTYAQKSSTFDPDPLSRPAEIEWGGTDLVETPIKDINDHPLVNSAGDLYDGLPERPIRGAAECSITRNESANPATTITNFSYTTNNATWNGVSQGNAMFGKIAATKVVEVVNGSSVTYWKVTYPIRFRKDNWRLKPWDRGWRIRVDTNGDGSDDNVQKIKDFTGEMPTSAPFLDGSGHILAPGTSFTQVIFPTAGYQIIAETDWSTLTLPNPFA